MAFGLLSLMRCFELLRKRSLMEQVNSQRQQDELLASVELGRVHTIARIFC
jgi:hypothetical protein